MHCLLVINVEVDVEEVPEAKQGPEQQRLGYAAPFCGSGRLGGTPTGAVGDGAGPGGKIPLLPPPPVPSQQERQGGNPGPSAAASGGRAKRKGGSRDRGEAMDPEWGEGSSYISRRAEKPRRRERTERSNRRSTLHRFSSGRRES